MRYFAEDLEVHWRTLSKFSDNGIEPSNVMISGACRVSAAMPPTERPLQLELDFSAQALEMAEHRSGIEFVSSLSTQVLNEIAYIKAKALHLEGTCHDKYFPLLNVPRYIRSIDREVPVAWDAPASDSRVLTRDIHVFS